jgi:nitroimidazol reductase NimA-like FMN-containing flavoprotein (pyridoxamine 5'-phosphate oxidase superfamily)
MTRLDLSLSREELDDYLRSEATIRLATVNRDGTPHIVPLWFVWLDGAVFMNSTLGNRTVRNLERDRRATGCVDDGRTYDDLRGAVLHGPVEPAGDDPRLPEVERLWSAKYLAGNPVPFRTWKGRVWLRMDPDRVASWDFRKIPEARARARAGA